jgi:hypothetical protein
MQISSEKKVGLKYCGGCNPGFSRKDLVFRIQSSCAFEIQWVSPDTEGVSRLLIVNGCDVACADPAPFEVRGMRVFVITEEQSDVLGSFSKFIIQDG